MKDYEIEHLRRMAEIKDRFALIESVVKLIFSILFVAILVVWAWMKQ